MQSMRNTILTGQLEIDHDRGVIYFHLSDQEEVMDRGVVTALRICSLPRPIPQVKERLLDITHMHGCDWKDERNENKG